MKILDLIQKAFNDLGITVFDSIFQIIRDFFKAFEVE